MSPNQNTEEPTVALLLTWLSRSWQFELTSQIQSQSRWRTAFGDLPFFTFWFYSRWYHLCLCTLLLKAAIMTVIQDWLDGDD